MNFTPRMLVILLGVLLSSQLSQAIIFGGRMGIHYGNASRTPDDNLSTDIEPGYIIGGTMDFPIAESKIVRGRLEVLWEQKGWREEGIIDEDSYHPMSYKGSAYINEFVFAALVHVRLGKTRAVPYILFGPEFGIKDKAEAKVKIDHAYFTLKDDIPDWEKVDPSFNIGAGLVLPVSQSEALLEIRYNFGLRNMYTGEDYLMGSSAPEVKLNGVQVSFGIQIGHPKGT